MRVYDQNIEYFVFFFSFNLSKYKRTQSHPSLKLKDHYYRVPKNPCCHDHRSYVSVQMYKAIAMSACF